MKKIVSISVGLMLLLGFANQTMAFEYFVDSRLIRVVYDRGGNFEVVTDLGPGWDFTSPTTVNHLFNTNTFSLSDLQISSWDDVYVAYFMRDVLVGATEAWTSGPLTGQANAARQWFAYVGAYGNLAAYNQRTGSPHNVNPQDLPNQSYNMTMGEQGRFSSFLPVGTQSPGDASLAGFNAPGIQFVDQKLYYYANPNAAGPGLAVYTIRTWEDGTTEINPVEAGQPGSIQFSSATYSVNENGGSILITVTRTGGSNGAVGVSYATSNGTATEGSDYTSASSTLNWDDGDASAKTFSITILDDAIYEGNETVLLTLSNPAGGATLGSPSSAVLTIVENDPAPVGTLQFSSATYSVNENGGSILITVTRTGGSSGAVGVSYATSNGTATAGSDYTSASGTLNWDDGDASEKTFSVTILDDATFEGNETVLLTLSNPAGGATLGSPSSAVLTIVENDPAPVGTLQFSSATYSVNENGGSILITVTRTGGSSGAVGVSYATSNGTATAGSDYTSASGTLNWDDGDASEKTFEVTIIDDATYEGNETVQLTLSDPTGGATLGSPSSAVLTIVENDPAPNIVDYDGDGKTDIAVYRTETGAWYIIPSSNPSAPYGLGWGGDPTDKPVPGDYDGDGKTDIAVYRTETGAWYVIPSSNPSAPYGLGWGGDPTDKPAPGDYDGDGKTDIAVYRTETGAWYVIPSSNPSAPYGLGWGGDPTDIPVTVNPSSMD